MRSKCSCCTSLGAFSVFSSRREATVRHFYSFSRLFANRHGNTGQLQACDAGQESDEEERETRGERERGWYSQKKCTAANHEVSAGGRLSLGD